MLLGLRSDVGKRDHVLILIGDILVVVDYLAELAYLKDGVCATLDIVKWYLLVELISTKCFDGPPC